MAANNPAANADPNNPYGSDPTNPNAFYYGGKRFGTTPAPTLDELAQQNSYPDWASFSADNPALAQQKAFESGASESGGGYQQAAVSDQLDKLKLLATIGAVAGGGSLALGMMGPASVGLGAAGGAGAGAGGAAAAAAPSLADVGGVSAGLPASLAGAGATSLSAPAAAASGLTLADVAPVAAGLPASIAGGSAAGTAAGAGGAAAGGGTALT